jgi:hypothetical protein
VAAQLAAGIAATDADEAATIIAGRQSQLLDVMKAAVHRCALE